MHWGTLFAVQPTMFNPLQIKPLWPNHHIKSDEYSLIHLQLYYPNQYICFYFLSHVQDLLHLQLTMAMLLQKSIYAHHLNMLDTTLQLG